MKDNKIANKELKSKKVYIRPTLTQIDLAADEVMVNNCKVGSASGPFKTCAEAGVNPCWKEGS